MSFNPVPVSIKNKNNNDTLGNGDRVLISLLNNSLEVYHISAPDGIPHPLTAVEGTSSSSKNKKVTNITKSEESVLKIDKNENLMDIDNPEEGDMIRNDVEANAEEHVTGMAVKGEVVIKQSIIDLHGHRSDVRSVCLSSDGLQLATCSSDGVKVRYILVFVSNYINPC